MPNPGSRHLKNTMERNKKLKRISLTTLIAGYVLAISFVILMIFNIPEKKEITAKALDVETVEHNTTIIKEKIVYEPHGTLPHVEYVDHLDGVIIDNTGEVVTAVVRDDGIIIDDHINTINGARIPDRDINRYNHNGRVVERDIRGNHVAGGRGNVDRGHRSDRVDVADDATITYDDAVRRDTVIDPGLLDRRIRELRENDKIGLDTKDGIALDRLTPVNKGDNSELGEIDDFNNVDVSADGGYGVGKGGQLYAYNFPSQGVGAGVGSGGLGASTGTAAGLGAGIGEAVLNGEAVPTLGGIGTYNSVQTIPPGSGNDKDKDGLSVEAEIALGTDPTKSDSDGDGYSDGTEIESYTDPKDSTSNPGVPGSPSAPTMGGVGGLTGGAGAGCAAGLMIGQVNLPTGMGMPGGSCDECEGECRGHGHGRHNYDHLPKDGALHIMMHVDGSGSILNTRKQLDIMKETLLKTALLPYYNNDEDLYNRRVTIVDGSGERTLKFFTAAAKKDNVLAVVFQDEAQPAYHLPNFNKKPEEHYLDDLGKLKASLNGYGGVYRGVMFQVDRGKTFAKSFKEFVDNAFNGEGYLKGDNLKKYHRDNNTNHIKNRNGIIFSDEYHAKDSGDPQYYLDLIFNASKRIGLDLDIYGAGLSDGRYNKKTD
jgi:hypothetical protein